MLAGMGKILAENLKTGQLRILGDGRPQNHRDQHRADRDQRLYGENGKLLSKQDSQPPE